jgi:hypothetical protein
MRTSLRRRQCCSIALIVSAVTGCGHPPHDLAFARESSVGDEIPRAMIDSLRGRVQTALDLVRLLRPTLLISRDSRVAPSRTTGPFADTPGVRVYVDELYMGDAQTLAFIPARSVVSIRRYSGATTPPRYSPRYGERLTSGVIVIITSASAAQRR